MRGDVFVSEPSSAQLYLPLFQFKQSGEKKSLRFNTISRTTRCPSGDTSPALNRFLPIAPTGLLIVCILRVMQHASRLSPTRTPRQALETIWKEETRTTKGSIPANHHKRDTNTDN
ncbi:hypothetical protein LSAT2_011761 [Lamellibrachia satsuma]|nr:hypothetical protein LSAT2_011761 [Lamellibrachia satsuma]